MKTLFIPAAEQEEGDEDMMGGRKREAVRQKAKQRLGRTAATAEEMPIKNEKCQDYFLTK